MRSLSCDRDLPALPPTAARSSQAISSSPLPVPRPMARISPSRRSQPARWRLPAESRPEGLPDTVAFIRVKNPRRALALSRGKFFPRQPQTIAAVTGTSGKTSVAAFTRQIWSMLGHQAASIGTIGVVSPKGERYGSLTTPDPVELHRTLDQLAREGVTHLALEASSQGSISTGSTACALQPVPSPICRATISIIIRRIEAYLAAKLRLFDDLIAPGGTRWSALTIATPGRWSRRRKSVA